MFITLFAGVPERLITGDASEREKFNAWAATVPQSLGNPLHHWTALELKRYFGIDEALSPESAKRVWDACNARLAEPGFTARGLLAQRGVACVCTSDRLLDDLSPPAAIAREGGALRVLPSLRADDVMAVESPEFANWLRALAAATGVAIDGFDAFRAAVRLKLDDFGRARCRLSDYGLDEFAYSVVREDQAASLFEKCLRGLPLSKDEAVRLRSAILRFLGVEYVQRNWIMHLHLGAQRRTSTRLRGLAGPAGGYAAIGEPCNVPGLCTWFDDLEQAGGLPCVILYPLNPADFIPLAVLTGSFAEDGVRGKLQLGPAWWFNDHASGMRAQLEAIANHGLLANFIGMTTDLRSLLSMARHEYFRARSATGLANRSTPVPSPPTPRNSARWCVHGVTKTPGKCWSDDAFTLMNHSSFAGKTAVVTGAGGTLCSAIAKDLARKGAKVALLGRTAASLEAVAVEIRAAGGIALPITCDVVDRASVEPACDAVTRELGVCHFLLNGAGGNHADAITTVTEFSAAELSAEKPAAMRGFFDLDLKRFDDVVRVNTLGTVIPCQGFGRDRAKLGRGSILNFASMNRYRPLTRVAA